MVRSAIAAFCAFSLAFGLAGAAVAQAGEYLVAEDATPKAQPAEPEKPAAEPEKPAEGSEDAPPAEPDAGAGADEGDLPADDLNLGDVPVIEVVELTPETARKAVDAFFVVRDKYKDSTFEQYETLQAYVEKAPDGRAFETDMKSFGFATADDWYRAVTTVSLAYSALTDQQFSDIQQQIEDFRKDPELEQEMKDKLIKGLEATIPTENNRKIVEALIADPAYTEKLKSLVVEEE